jgi:hypothetical protein
MRKWLCAAAMVLLAGCTTTTQTTSGRTYLGAYEPQPIVAGAATDIDQRVREVAAVEPTLRFPARLGLARIENGDLAPLPRPEAEAWRALANRLGSSFGEFVPISPMLAEMFDQSFSTRGDGSPQALVRNVIEKIRLGAARQHVDAVLIYEVQGTAETETNALAIADLTIIGMFILPSDEHHVLAQADALLLDVRNGYPYGTASAVSEDDSLSPTAGSYTRRDARLREAKADAALKLTGEVETLMRKLARELPEAQSAAK